MCFGLSGEGHISFQGLFTLVWSFLLLITNEALSGGLPCFHGGHLFPFPAFSTFLPGEELPSPSLASPRLPSPPSPHTFLGLASCLHRLCLSEWFSSQSGSSSSVPQDSLLLNSVTVRPFLICRHCLSCQCSPLRKGKVVHMTAYRCCEARCWCRVSLFFGMCVLAAQVECNPFEGKSARSFLSLSPNFSKPGVERRAGPGGLWGVTSSLFSVTLPQPSLRLTSLYAL